MVNQPTLLKSFSFALQGIYHAWRDNRNFRIHCGVAIIVFVLAYFLKVTREDFTILIVMIVLAIAAEMINTSLEEMVDLITTEHRQEAKVAKDVAAGMVLVVSVGAAVIGLIIFVPYLV